ncbi:MAG: hypothetical protein JWO09_3448 [Bacteroidetes bacterium]|nr:hypothetical protein [Bacteroidota bacterium]
METAKGKFIASALNGPFTSIDFTIGPELVRPETRVLLIVIFFPLPQIFYPFIFSFFSRPVKLLFSNTLVIS